MVSLAHQNFVRNRLEKKTMSADFFRWVTGSNLPVWRAPASTMSVFHPSRINYPPTDMATGEKIAGILWGHAGRNRSGGAYRWLIQSLYKDRPDFGDTESSELRNGNILVAGEPGFGKSTFARLDAGRSVGAGFRLMYLDPRHDAALLAGSIPGSITIGLEQKDNTYFNFMDSRIDLDDMLVMVRSAVNIVLADSQEPALNLKEANLLDLAVTKVRSVMHASEPGGVATMVSVVEAIRGLNRVDAEFLDMSLAEMKVCRGRPLHAVTKLARTFNQPTTPGLLEGAPFYRVKCSHPDKTMIAVLVLIVNYLTMSNYVKKNADRRIHRWVVDESFSLLGFVESIKHFQQGEKYSRFFGMGITFICHTPASIVNSAVGRQVLDIFADSATKVVFRLDVSTLTTVEPFTGKTNAEILGVPPHLFDVVARLKKLECLVIMPGQQPTPVKLFATNEERRLSETSSLMHGDIEGFNKSVG